MGTNYYVDVPPCENACEHCAKETQLHLGKSSGGWRFSFHADPAWPRERAFFEWVRRAASGPIKNEYGEVVQLHYLLNLIYETRGGKSHAAEYPSLGDYESDEGHSFTTVEFS